jgi:hypothetical protein
MINRIDDLLANVRLVPNRETNDSGIRVITQTAVVEVIIDDPELLAAAQGHDLMLRTRKGETLAISAISPEGAARLALNQGDLLDCKLELS